MPLSVLYHGSGRMTRGEIMSTVYNWDDLPVNLNLNYICLIFGVSVSTVKRWLYDGTIKGTKIGRKWFFDKEYIKSLTEIKK